STQHHPHPPVRSGHGCRLRHRRHHHPYRQHRLRRHLVGGRLMAGSGASQGFNASEFRNAIRATMTMGLPQQTQERITFVCAGSRTFPIEDPSDDPYDWTATPTGVDLPSTVQVPAAVQWGIGNLDDTSLGQFDISHAVVTLLDVDYVLVAEATSV